MNGLSESHPTGGSAPYSPGGCSGTGASLAVKNGSSNGSGSGVACESRNFFSRCCAGVSTGVSLGLSPGGLLGVLGRRPGGRGGSFLSGCCCFGKNIFPRSGVFSVVMVITQVSILSEKAVLFMVVSILASRTPLTFTQIPRVR